MGYLKRMREATMDVLSLPDFRCPEALDEDTREAVHIANHTINNTLKPRPGVDSSRVLKEAFGALLKSPYFQKSDPNKWDSRTKEAYYRGLEVFRYWFLSSDNEAKEVEIKRRQNRK